MNSHEVYIQIHQGCFAGTGAIVRLPQCQWSKPDGYGKISQCITTTKYSKAKTVCIFVGIYCTGNKPFQSLWKRCDLDCITLRMLRCFTNDIFANYTASCTNIVSWFHSKDILLEQSCIKLYCFWSGIRSILVQCVWYMNHFRYMWERVSYYWQWFLFITDILTNHGFMAWYVYCLRPQLF